jgi:hypothetical protein
MDTKSAVVKKSIPEASSPDSLQETLAPSTTE